ncbi:MAG: TetR/AcrR family transcriptional regulator [Pseudomonadales bacterium]|nr:TetR/AcrR family transcriptional regulator [Pseudomonadales bacterium]
MTKKKPLTPRKMASQARSKQTIEFILQAAAQVLEDKGYDKATTDRIAEKAGVSIGTLYQYFPNKDSIFVELRVRHIRVIETIFDTLLQLKPENEPLTSDMLKLLISSMIDHNLNENQQHQSIEDAIPKTELLQKVESEIHANISEKANTLLSSIPNLRVTQIDLAVAIIFQTLASLIHWYLFNQREKYSRDIFLDEVTDLLSRYLITETH